MKVKIIKHTMSFITWWYHDKIGDVFEVVTGESSHYEIPNGHGILYIQKRDAIPLLRKDKLKRILQE